MSRRFYTNSNLTVGRVLLEGDEAHHLSHVCRFHVGDEVTLFNGDGREYSARIMQISRRQVELEITAMQSPERELPYPLHIAVTLPKGERADWLVEKLTELGVTTLVPLQSRRSVVRPSISKLDRLRRLVIEASKQCGRNHLMTIDASTDWATYWPKVPPQWQRLIAHPTGSSWHEKLERPTVVAIGPEGGFDDSELVDAIAAGWRCVALGPRILRIETAAVACAALLAIKLL